MSQKSLTKQLIEKLKSVEENKYLDILGNLEKINGS